jgi:hypothetical protein
MVCNKNRKNIFGRAKGLRPSQRQTASGLVSNGVIVNLGVMDFLAMDHRNSQIPAVIFLGQASLHRATQSLTAFIGGAPAILRRERRWVLSAFGGEFNAALVAPINSPE